MATVKEHYSEVLSDVYSWMFGGFEVGIQRNIEFINKHKLTPKSSGIAVDLGAGCGFQSIPLAKAGYSVTAFDIDAKLLQELKGNSDKLKITTVQGDLIDFDTVIKNNVELIVCMTDTIVHLESKEKVISLFNKVFTALETSGKFIITFRDLTHELKDLDRFLPVKNDDNTIFTCFLEYEPETVKVHDIVYKKLAGEWKLFKSFYRKLRLSESWILDELSQSGFEKIESTVENGLITIVANKQA
ncbi:class I SAM-dependent methyltransferase [Candidatus Albibeggiatoa sp. nov. NOAA]|uniref:class I SAM-dependent methyltransferase n=1 Tax=Candidatus Albibeggiatoa sp. nov. NOAA TaxID=3162724 RepID=UPI0032F1B60B|nr:class I SAM-dependent methyltransferase [Thiotrichaceae bacterium]